ncbi:MAG: hypothetical protein IJS80_05695 [Lachnospiraceae bacterium]|nr:hypothetical protein [Lachnospiraceae bacterium]
MMRRREEGNWPFDNGGFLTGKQLLNILILERREELEELLKTEASDELAPDDLKKMYKDLLSEKVLGIPEKEREFLKMHGDKAKERAGDLAFVIDFTDWEIRTGSFCRIKNHMGTELSPDGQIYKKAGFLYPDNREEEERIIRLLAIEETGRELTCREPEIESGTFCAVRPPAGKWGMMIKGRRGRQNEMHMF